VTPLIERHVKDAINTTLIPAYQQSNAAMHQELTREVHSEILSLKKEIITWQGEALKGSEVSRFRAEPGSSLMDYFGAARPRYEIWRSRSAT
jgi:hypothetical protein